MLDPARTEIRYNSEWSDPLGARGMIELAAKYTVARMMERNDFHQRFSAGTPISVHEFLYPLMQGYDSVALKSDLELGGTDQKFNLLMGRHLQAEYGQKPQCILTMPLLEGLDGVDKMSKSKNNYIGITENANTMFAKVMSISDTLMWRWYTLLSFDSLAAIEALKTEVASGRNPRDAKVKLAKEITTRFHSAAAADAAEQDFINRSKGGIPDDIPELSLSGAPAGIGALLKQANRYASIKGKAARQRPLMLGQWKWVALAVVSVVIFHAFGNWLPGGFIGVDVFFVISGYLITGLILREHDQASFSFARFYARRTRRIFPALMLILGLGWVVGWLALSSNEYSKYGKYMAGGAVFLDNFMFWRDAGYFDSQPDSRLSPTSLSGTAAAQELKREAKATFAAI